MSGNFRPVNHICGNIIFQPGDIIFQPERRRNPRTLADTYTSRLNPHRRLQNETRADTPARND